MKPAIAAAICLLAASFQLPSASAQVYQWKDSSGRTVISDTPPPASVRTSRSIDASPPPVSPVKAAEGAAAAPKSAAEKELEFRKRRQEAHEKADKESKEQVATAQVSEYCARARGQLASLESGDRLSLANEKGERRFLQESERQQEIERVQRFLAENCK